MSAFKFIEGGWESYRDIVIPADAPDTQIKESRQAFYAGASILFQTIMLALSPGDDVADADMAIMDALQTEVDAFGLELDLRLLPVGGHGCW